MPSPSAPALCVIGGTVVWIIILFSLAVLKVLAAPTLLEGLLSFIDHFTNYAWTLAIVFFASYLGFARPAHNNDTHLQTIVAADTPATQCCQVRCAACCVAYLFFPLHAIVMFVMIAVFVMLFINPAFITNLFTVLSPGVVMVANDIFHIIPVIALLYFMIVLGPLLCFGANQECHRAGKCKWLYVTYTLVAAPLLFLVYLAVLAIRVKTLESVYGISMANPWLISLCFLGASIVINGSLWCILYNFCYVNGEPSNYSLFIEARAMLIPEREIFAKQKEYPDADLHDASAAAMTGMDLEYLLSTRHRDVDIEVPPPPPRKKLHFMASLPRRI